MLYKSTVKPELLRLLDHLMQEKSLANLRLVGGTALALQIGHRESIDIDLFGNINFEEQIGKLSIPGKIITIKKSEHINIFSIDGIKLDIVNYRYPWISPTIEEEGLRIAAIEDIAAMKLNAICGRGTKKDFVDVFFILQKYSIEKLFEFYNQKFDDGNLFLVKKSLLYFEDADPEPMPKMKEGVSWEQIKDEIKKILTKNI